MSHTMFPPAPDSVESVFYLGPSEASRHRWHRSEQTSDAAQAAGTADGPFKPLLLLLSAPTSI